MKTKKELNEIKEEVENANKQRHALTEEELEQVTGGGMLWASKCKFTGTQSCVGHHDECGACQGLL